MHILTDIDRNYVVVAGTTVPRPSSVSPLQWLEFWEDARTDWPGDGAVVPMVGSGVSRKLPKRKKR